MKKTVSFLACILLIFFTHFNNANANNLSHKKTINILTWWEYLDHPEIISDVEKKCGVKISYDKYFSNDEFLRRLDMQKESYDILIFSDAIYNSVKNKIPHFTSPLSKQSKDYHPIIRSHYKKMKYPNNVVYFFHSITGILWNPKNITLSSNDSITTIFNKAKQNFVVITDDSIDANRLVESYLNENEKEIRKKNSLSISNFQKMIKNAKVYITNNYSQIYLKPEFSFALSWSGDALLNLKINKNYQFLIHPQTSYISSDLIAYTSPNSTTFCVAEYLSNKKTLSNLQKKVLYFSPYTDYSNIKDPIFKNIYQNFVKLLPTTYWPDSSKDDFFQEINKSWQLVKLHQQKQS